MILQIDDWVKNRKKINDHPEPNITVDVKNNAILIYYIPRTDCSKYSISDFNGKILFTGDLTSDESATQFCNSLAKGIYNLTIIDGEDMVQKQFSID